MKLFCRASHAEHRLRPELDPRLVVLRAEFWTERETWAAMPEALKVEGREKWEAFNEWCIEARRVAEIRPQSAPEPILSDSDTFTGSTAEMRAKEAQERANILARNVREFREAEAKAKAVHIDHADHAMQCGDCDNLYKRIASLERRHMNQVETIMEMQATIARLERKAKKWKRRAKAKTGELKYGPNLVHHITETPWEPKPSHSRDALAFAEAQSQ